jgi:hypothetical protein
MCTYMHIHTFTRSRIHTHAYSYNTYKYTLKHTDTHKDAHLYIRVHSNTQTHINTQTHTRHGGDTLRPRLTLAASIDEGEVLITLWNSPGPGHANMMADKSIPFDMLAHDDDPAISVVSPLFATSPPPARLSSPLPSPLPSPLSLPLSMSPSMPNRSPLPLFTQEVLQQRHVSFPTAPNATDPENSTSTKLHSDNYMLNFGIG